MISVSFRGTNYNVPEPSDTFPQSLTDYLNAISTGAVPFPTTADIDLGASGFGLKLAYAKTRAANPSASGLLRLANGDSVAWRNLGNTADLALAVDAQNQLTFAGNEVTGNPFLGANTAAAQSIPNNAATLVVFGTVELDTDAAYNSSTGRFTVPAGKGGHYNINATIDWNASPTAGSAIQIFKNAVALKSSFQQVAAAGISQSIAATVALVPGDIIDIRAFQASGGAVALAAFADRNFVSIKRIPT